MEVVVLRVTDEDKATDKVGESWYAISITDPWLCLLSIREHTGSARVLAAHVAVLISLNKALGLGSRGRATRELLVESDDPLHARGISGTANGLEIFLSAFLGLCISFASSSVRIRSVHRGVGCAFRGSGGRSEENGRGFRSTYVGRSDLE